MNSKELGRLLSLAQVGTEMVVPIGVGVYLDSRFGWSPWATTVGAVLGLSGGLAHLIWLGNQKPPEERKQSSRPNEESR